MALIQKYVCFRRLKALIHVNTHESCELHKNVVVVTLDKDNPETLHESMLFEVLVPEQQSPDTFFNTESLD